MTIQNALDMQSWADSRDRGAVTVAVSRAALRLLPVFSASPATSALAPWRREADPALLWRRVIRAMLCASVAGAATRAQVDQGTVRAAAISAARNVVIGDVLHMEDYPKFVRAAVNAVRWTAVAAGEVRSEPVARAVDAAVRALSAADVTTATGDHYTDISRDVDDLGRPDSPSWHLLETPLWWGQVPANLADHWQGLCDAFDRDPSDWRFWIDWWQRHRDGRPQNWPLLGQLAILPEKHWEAATRGDTDADPFTNIITKSREAVEPDARNHLRMALLAADTVPEERLGMGGNFPPEPISDPPFPAEDLSARFDRLEQALAALRDQTMQNDAPRRDAVEPNVLAVRSAWQGILLWFGGKADAFAGELAKEAGKQVAQIIKWGTLLGAVYTAAEAWLQTLPF